MILVKLVAILISLWNWAILIIPIQRIFLWAPTHSDRHGRHPTAIVFLSAVKCDEGSDLAVVCTTTGSSLRRNQYPHPDIEFRPARQPHRPQISRIGVRRIQTSWNFIKNISSTIPNLTTPALPLSPLLFASTSVQGMGSWRRNRAEKLEETSLHQRHCGRDP